MKIAVFGAGGVGAYFGGRLAQAGETVTFIARGEHLKAIRSRGLKVDSVKGDFVVHPAQASDNPAEIGAVEAVLVCVKAWQVSEIAPSIRPLLGTDTMVIPLGNGVDAPEQLVAALGAAPVLGGLCRISAFLAAPGHVKHVGIEPMVAFGELDGPSGERVERLRQAFDRAGVNVVVPADIWAAMWEKFLFIAAVSGLGAVTRSPIGVFRSVPETRRLLANALAEAEAVARARGVALAADAAGRILTLIDGLPPATLASMQRDIADGKPSELEAQNGAVARMGRETGVPTPTHDFIYAALLPQELKARG